MATLKQSLGSVVCVLGAQWGDEGKGKLVDILSQEYDIVARCAGGANAGHTVYYKDDEGKQVKVVFHLVPSGILHKDKICVMGNGTVIHLPTLIDELHALKETGYDFKNRFWISDRAHIIFDYHLLADGAQEVKNKIGTTKRGIGPAYAAKISRHGIRAHELRDQSKLAARIRENAERLMAIYHFEFDIESEIAKYKDIAELVEPYICDATKLIHDAIDSGKTVLVEGAQGTMLDIDHGTYPFVTSSSTTIGGVVHGMGLPPNKIDSVVGIVKAYTTRVGEGPLPTELANFEGEMLQEKGAEFGATTGRPRRCGWFDVPVVSHAVRLNGFDCINLTKLDVLTGFKTLKIGYQYRLDGEICTAIPANIEDFARVEVDYIEMPAWDEDLSECKNFSDLPKNAQAYVRKIEELTEVMVRFIGVGIYRNQMIVM